jgi:hypothetical protein
METGTVLRAWNPLFSRYFACSTLRTLGYRTRVAIANASDGTGHRPEGVRLRLSAYASDGRRLLAPRDCGMLAPGGYWTLDDVDTFLSDAGVDLRADDGEWLVIVHQTPESHGEAPRDLALAEVTRWVGMGDDFVEYVHPRTGVVGGVFYQCPPLNDPRLGALWMTVCQSPKLLFDDGLDPFLLLLNVSTADPSTPGEMRLSILGADGVRRGGRTVTVPAFASRVVSLRSALADTHYRGNATLIAVSAGCTLIPFTFVRDRHSNALAIDHTMPPANYHSAWADKQRRFAWTAELLRRTGDGRL